MQTLQNLFEHMNIIDVICISLDNFGSILIAETTSKADGQNFR